MVDELLACYIRHVAVHSPHIHHVVLARCSGDNSPHMPRRFLVLDNMDRRNRRGSHTDDCRTRRRHSYRSPGRSILLAPGPDIYCLVEGEAAWRQGARGEEAVVEDTPLSRASVQPGTRC